MPNNSSISHSSSHTTFPITAVAIIGILATGVLLVSYYIFVIKCCLNWHRIDLLRRFSFSSGTRQRRRSSNNEEGSLTALPEENRGLDEDIIRSIPIFQYKKNSRKRSLGEEEKCLSECAICLNEYQEEEKLRIIPNCGHIFHIDCIDIWLQNNANCPLCRTSLSRFNLFSPSFSRNDDFVIEMDEQEEIVQENNRNVEETGDSVSAENSDNFLKRKKKTSMGDECIDIREGGGGNYYKDEGLFEVNQPMRRSFSMDSASDPQLHLAIQVILQQQQQQEVIRRSFFGFGGHDRTSAARRSAVLPLHLGS